MVAPCERRRAAPRVGVVIHAHDDVRRGLELVLELALCSEPTLGVMLVVAHMANALGRTVALAVVVDRVLPVGVGATGFGVGDSLVVAVHHRHCTIRLQTVLAGSRALKVLRLLSLAGQRLPAA